MAFGTSHPEWREFEAKQLEAIAELHTELESPALDLAQTNYVRGRIAAIRAILEAGTPPPPAVHVPGYGG